MAVSNGRVNCPSDFTWRDAVPPGGAAVYTGNAIPEWRSSLIVGNAALSASANGLHSMPPGQLQRHGGAGGKFTGRLREVIMGPDRELYVTTSNCDGRGSCPRDGDRIQELRGKHSWERKKSIRFSSF